MRLKQLAPLACDTRVHCQSCRTDPEFRHSVTGVREFECPSKVKVIDGEVVEAAETVGAVSVGLNIITSAARATKSIAKTSLRIDRASASQVKARLDVCRQCPGNHAVMKDSEVHTCGPMLESMAKAGGGTCGCVLRKKALDLAEDCPFGYWPKLSQTQGLRNAD